MKKIVSFLICAMICLSAVAYDLTGMKFSGKKHQNGIVISFHMEFLPDSRVTATYSMTGSRVMTDPNMPYDIDGDIIRVLDSSNEYAYLRINGDGTNVTSLTMLDLNGNPLVDLKKDTPKKSPARKSSGTKKRRR